MSNNIFGKLQCTPSDQNENLCLTTGLHASDDTSNDTLCDSPFLDLQTLTPKHTR